MKDNTQETYNLEFTIDKISCDNFKQKQSYMIRNIIAGGRLMHEMEFSSYANISFSENDEKRRFPKVTLQEDFNRVRTNCLVYDLYKTDINHGKYDKCFIYQHNGIKLAGFYGYVLYNSETGKMRHRHWVNKSEDDLVIALSKMFNIFRFQDKYEPYIL